MGTLLVAATQDYSTAALSDIAEIIFDNLASAATATFAAAQFDNNAIYDDVLFFGTSQDNHVVVTGGSVDGSLWQFSLWSTADTITLAGSTAADVITGSSVGDVISGRRGRDSLSGGEGDDRISGGDGRDIITGGGGTDDLAGGNGNDEFVYVDNADAPGTIESVDGGNGSGDRIVLDGGFDGLSLFLADIVNVETVKFEAAGLVLFNALDIGSGLISTIVGDVGANKIRIAGSADLSGVTFLSWAGPGALVPDRIWITGFAGADDTIIGSSRADDIIGFDGDDDIDGGGGDDLIEGDWGEDDISGGSGDDTIIYNEEADLVPGESVDGGSGTDTLAIYQSGGDSLYDFSPGAFAGLEQLAVIGEALNDSTVTLRFTNYQFGSGSIVSAVLDAPTVIEVSGAVVSLGEVAFSGALENSSAAITGNTIADVLVGGMLSDVITGGHGTDVMTGGGGDDTFRYLSVTEIAPGEYADGGDGIDTIELAPDLQGIADLRTVTIVAMERLAMLGDEQYASLSSELASALSEIQGAAGHQAIAVFGTDTDLSHLSFQSWGARDEIFIDGTDEADVFVGSSENDIFIGELNGDELSGGGGYDVFVYQRIEDSSAGEGRDVITDFTQGEDMIDARSVADELAFIATNDFAGAGTAELRYDFTANGDTQITVDADGDAGIDMRILLRGEVALTEGDFFLTV